MFIALGVAIFVFVLSQFLFIKFNGKPVTQTVVPSQSTTVGSGKKLRYAIIGDSTAAGVGGDYEEGIAVGTANYLAKHYQVEYLNRAVSGAKTKEVVKIQLDDVLAFNPHVVLVSVGANDVTHLSSRSAISHQLDLMVEKLISNNCSVKIVLTGSPDMGSVPRFPQPLRYFAGARTRVINKMFEDKVAQHKLTFAPIADKTGVAFRNNPELFAADKFHPTSAGYATWVPVLNKALENALAHQPSHC